MQKDMSSGSFQMTSHEITVRCLLGDCPACVRAEFSFDLPALDLNLDTSLEEDREAFRLHQLRQDPQRRARMQQVLESWSDHHFGIDRAAEKAEEAATHIRCQTSAKAEAVAVLRSRPDLSGPAQAKLYWDTYHRALARLLLAQS